MPGYAAHFLISPDLAHGYLAGPLAAFFRNVDKKAQLGARSGGKFHFSQAVTLERIDTDVTDRGLALDLRVWPHFAKPFEPVSRRLEY